MKKQLGPTLLTGRMLADAYKFSQLWKECPEDAPSALGSQLDYHLEKHGFTFEGVLACYIELHRFKSAIVAQVDELDYPTAAQILYNSAHHLMTEISVMLQVREVDPEKIGKDAEVIAERCQVMFDKLAHESSACIPDAGKAGDLPTLTNVIINVVVEATDLFRTIDSEVE